VFKNLNNPNSYNVFDIKRFFEFLRESSILSYHLNYFKQGIYFIIMSNLCVKCRGKGFCGKPCRILEGLKTKMPKIKTHFSGSTPPEVFVGRVGYPEVFSGVLAPVEKGETAGFSLPEDWVRKNLSIEQILDMRGRMIYARTKMNIKIPNKIKQVTQELALSSKPVSTEFFLKKAPVFEFSASRYFQIMSNPAPIQKIILEENPKVEKKVDYITGDYDVKATDAVLELYNSNIITSHLQKLLATGLLGVKVQRKMVPTRWSITAVDDMIGKKLLEKVRTYGQLNEIQLFHYYYNGNNFELLFLPENFSFEVIEVSMPGNVWAVSQTKSATKAHVMQDYEGFYGRKTYAENVAGGYYADRLAAVEYLERIKRQATVLLFHEEREEYYAPLGVGIIRESLRNALKEKPEKPATVQEALEIIGKRVKYPLKKYKEKSWILNNYGKQKKLGEFFL